MYRPACIALVLALAFSRGVFAQEDLSPEEVALFEEDVLPVLEENCFKCHGGRDEIEGGLVLTSQRGLLRGGNRGPVVDRMTPESSFLLAMISYKDADHEMPPDGKLLPWDADALTEWVLRGSPWPGDASDEDFPLLHGMQLSDPELWAFRVELLARLAEPVLPSVELARLAGAFIDQAGREAVVRREQARKVVRFVLQFYLQLVRRLSGLSPEGDSEMLQVVETACRAGSFGVETAVTCAERCLDALDDIDRFAHQAAWLECWLHDLGRISQRDQRVSA